MANPSPSSPEEAPVVAPPATTSLDDDESEQSITMEILEAPEESEQSMTMEALAEPEPPPKSPRRRRPAPHNNSPNSARSSSSKSPAPPRPTRRLPRRSQSTDGSTLPSSSSHHQRRRRMMIPRSLSTDGSSNLTRGGGNNKRSPIRRGVTLGGSNGNGSSSGSNNRLPIRLPSKSSDRRLKMRMASEFSSERGLSSTTSNNNNDTNDDLVDLSKLLDENLDNDDDEKATTTTSSSLKIKRTDSIGKLKAIKAKLLLPAAPSSSSSAAASMKRSATLDGGRRRPFARSHSQSKLKVAHIMDVSLTDGSDKTSSATPKAATSATTKSAFLEQPTAGSLSPKRDTDAPKTPTTRQHFAMPSRRRKAPLRRANSMSAAKEELFILGQDLKEKEQQKQQKEQQKSPTTAPTSTPEKEDQDANTKIIIRSTSPLPKSKKKTSSGRSRSPTSPKKQTARLPPKRANSPTLSPSSSLSRLTISPSRKEKTETTKLLGVLPLPSLSATKTKKVDPVISPSEKPRSRSKSKNKESSMSHSTRSSKQSSYQKLGSKFTEKFSSSISGFSNSMTGLFLAPDDSKKGTGAATTRSRDDGDASKAALATIAAARRKKKMKLAQRGKGKSMQQNRSFGIVARSATSPKEIRRMSSSFSDFEDQQFKIPPKSKSGNSYFQWKADRTAIAEAAAVKEMKKKDKAVDNSSRKKKDKYSRTTAMKDKSVRSSSKDKTRLRESSKKSTLLQSKSWNEDSSPKEPKQMDPSILKKTKSTPKAEKARRRSSDLAQYCRDATEKDGDKTRSKSAFKTKKKEKKPKDKSTKAEEEDTDLSSNKKERSSSTTHTTTKKKKKKEAKKEDLSMSFSSFFGNKSKKPDANFDFSSLLPLEEDEPSLIPLPAQAEEISDFLTLEPEIVPWEGVDLALPEIVPGIDVTLPEIIPVVDVDLPEIIPEVDLELPGIVPWEGVDIALKRVSRNDGLRNTGGSENADTHATTEKDGQALNKNRAAATSLTIESEDGRTSSKDNEEAEKLKRELVGLKEERERARTETNKAEQEARQQKEYADALKAELVAAKKELNRLKEVEKGAKKKRNKASAKMKEEPVHDTQKTDIETFLDGTPSIIEKQKSTQVPVEENGPDIRWEAAKAPKHDDTVPETTPEKILHNVDTVQATEIEPMEDAIAEEPDMRWEVPQVLISVTRRLSPQDLENPLVVLQDNHPEGSAEAMEIEKQSSLEDALGEKAELKPETDGAQTSVNAASNEIIDQSERETPQVVKKERGRSSLLESDGSDSDDESQTTPTGRRRSVLDSSDDESDGDNHNDTESKRGSLLDSKDNASDKGDQIKSLAPRRSVLDSSDDETDSDSDGPNASKPTARRRSMLDFGSSDDNTDSDSDESTEGLLGKRYHASVEVFESSMSHVIPLDECADETAKKRGKVNDADEAAKSDSGGSLALNDLSDSSDGSCLDDVDAHCSMPDLDSEDFLGELPRISSKREQRRKESKMDYHASCSALDFVQLAPQNFVQQKEERFDDYYELGEILGEGEFGEVFVGYPRQGGGLGEERAIKIIDKSRMCDGDYEQVMNEFNLLKGLTHPNILTLYGFFEDTEKCYIVTDICKGGEMWDELHLRGSFAEEDAAAFMTNVLSAVKFLQSHKIVHRDINLENILLEENKELDQMKIIDFGLATKYEDGVKLTDLVGKVHYVPPEVLHMSYGGSKYDVWSCGVLCFIMLSGYAPFEGDNDGLVREQVLIGKVDFNDPAWEGISDEAKDFVNHLLTYEEDARPLPEQALKHAWIQNSIKSRNETFMESYGGSSISCLENMEDFAHDASLKLRQAVYTYIASQLLFKEEREEIDKVFRGMDEDCDGHLSKEDIEQGYKRFFDKELSEKELDNLFRRINTSGTGFIDYTEFVIAAMQKSKILDEEKLQAAFKSFDRGDKGFVSADDVKIALSGVIAFPENDDDGMSADDIVTEMIRQVDMEGDGTICYEDFEYMMMTSVPRAMDAEGEAAPDDDPKVDDLEEAPDGEHRNSIGVTDIGESSALGEDKTGLNYDWATTSWLGDGSHGDLSADGSNAENSFQLDLNVISEEG